VSYAEPPSSTSAFPLAARPSSSAKSIAKPARNNPVGDHVFDWNQVNAPGLSADVPKDPAHLVVPSSAQQGEMAMVPAPAPQPGVPTMVAEPDPPAQGTRGADTSWLLEILGALTGGVVGGAIVWYLSGSGERRVRAMEEEERGPPRAHNWASAYENRQDSREKQEAAPPWRYNQTPAYGDHRDTGQNQETPPWRHNQTPAHDDRWDATENQEADPAWGHNQASTYDDRWDSRNGPEAQQPRGYNQTSADAERWNSTDRQEVHQPVG
jgi:hypothetical protein